MTATTGRDWSDADVEALAEVLSWASGEMTRYSPTAHPDHNRWSWQGDGHGKALREEFRGQARHVLAAGWTRIDPTTEPGGDMGRTPGNGNEEDERE